MDRQLKSKAIKFKWSDYVQVKDRINFLSENYEWKYSVETDYEYFENTKTRVVKAKLTIDGCIYNWLAQEIEWTTFINKTSALENAETSAVGRACAMAWIWVIDSIASVDEINKATNRPSKKEFWEKEYKALVEKKSEYVDALGVLWLLDEKWYTISKERETKIKDLFN